MTQAPTPGPLDSESVKLLVKGDLISHPEHGVAQYWPVLVDDMYLTGPWSFIGRPGADGWMPWSGGENPVPGRVVEIELRGLGLIGPDLSDHFDWRHETDNEDQDVIAFRLAPTAPVEASGSEREHGPKCWGGTSFSDEMAHCYCGSTDLRPQPSGETREWSQEQHDHDALTAIAEHLRDNPAAPYSGRQCEEFVLSARDALLSARPLALGGGEVVNRECKQCGAFKPDLSAACTFCGSTTPARSEGQSDDLRTACQAVLDDYQTSDAHHPDHVLIRRTDFERIKVLVEAPVVVQAARDLVRQAHEILRSGNPPFSAREVNARGKLRDALNPDRARAEAQGEGAATDDLVDRFAVALKAKLRAAGEKYGFDDAWRKNDWRDQLVSHLQDHLLKGDPRDVAAYCAFAWHHGWSVSPPAIIRPAGWKRSDGPWPVHRQYAQDEGAAVTRLLKLADAALANVTAFEADARYIMGNTNYAITENARSEIRSFLLAQTAKTSVRPEALERALSILDRLLDHSGARGSFDAMKHGDAVKDAEELLRLARSPGHTDLMVTPESIDAYMKDNPMEAPAADADRVRIAVEALSSVVKWGESRCPCYNDLPDPCPLCDASVANLESCKSAEKTFPPKLLGEMRQAIAALKSTAAKEGGEQ